MSSKNVKVISQKKQNEDTYSRYLTFRVFLYFSFSLFSIFYLSRVMPRITSLFHEYFIFALSSIDPF